MESCAASILFCKRGKAELKKVVTPNDVYEYSLKHKDGRWGVLIQPLVVGLCPTDEAGGNRDFPPGSTRSFADSKNPAVAGHEFIGKVVRVNKNAQKKLSERNIAVGDIVAVDINIGCGECFPCRRGDPPLYCKGGATFLGVGTSPGAFWVKKQTGREHLPGAYTTGFVVAPARNVYKIPLKNVKNVNQLAVFSQTDAVACAKTSCDAMGITTFKQMRGFGDPAMLVIGSGRVGAWHVAVAKELLPNTQIFLADIDKENLTTVGNLFDIPEERRYLVSANSKNPYARKSLEAHFGKNILFDFVVDAAGHHTLSGRVIMQILRESTAKGGVFCTTSHTGVNRIDAGDPELILGMKRFLNGLSPQNNFEYAVSFLAKNIKKYEPFVKEIKGGLNETLAHIVETGGGEYKKQMEGTTFYSVVNDIDFLK
ncbi:MAG: alcohol dehydrogenase catalytic domain-containing protein [Parcubacteria group bacterium]|nr:alcohol dehydrogenase catalytic domain-containing protein [Parcubacteria group bacterium]